MKYSLWLAVAIAIALSSVQPSYAQDIGRVSPATVPLPLNSIMPVRPSQLRSKNPWNLPMTGIWRFRLIHGQIVNRHFVPAAAAALGFTASNYQTTHPPQDAFDHNQATRWCSEESSFPQWLQANLGSQKVVTAVALAWEDTGQNYQFLVQGSHSGKKWTTVVDRSKAPGASDGQFNFPPQRFKYIRVTVTGAESGWASLREFQIHIDQAGHDVLWTHLNNSLPPSYTNQFATAAYNDSHWHSLPVPSNWEIYGYSIPTYNAVDDTVGLYRRWVTVPSSYANHRIYWHFDGALEGAEVFVNGIRAGYHESGYTAFDVDLTGLVKPGKRNLFAVRVCKTTPSVDCETGDFQCLGGIYRDTSLIAVPMTHVQDIWVRTPLVHHYKDAILEGAVHIDGAPGEKVGLAGFLVGFHGSKTSVRVAAEGKISPNGTAVLSLSAPVQSPHLWSAEKPALYFLVLQLTQNGKPVERVEQMFGFHQLDIKNNIVLWNGVPIKLTGTCRHDFWANLGYALTDKQWIQDIDMMKDANINAVRTSHYNPASRFLELCEEKGLYILDEVPFCWIGDKVKDPAFLPPLLQRTTETIERDKNRPCVLAWSLGNENEYGINEQAVFDLARQMDPTRPAFVSEMSPANIKGQELADGHYPSPGDVDYAISHNSKKWPTIYTENPHTFWQKAAQDYDPGVSDLWSEALKRVWSKLWSSPAMVGSFIWEWQNQGIADRNADHTTDFWYGPNHLRQENNKGIVTSYRVPKAEYWTVKMVYSKVAIGGRTVAPHGGKCTVPFTNRYSFTNLSERPCHWEALARDKILSSGTKVIPCPPLTSATVSFPAPAGMTALRLEFDHPDGASITIANLKAVGSPNPAPPAQKSTGGALSVKESRNYLVISNNLQTVRFSKITGGIKSWAVRGKTLLEDGPILNLGEGRLGNRSGYFANPAPPTLSGARMIDQTLSDGSVDVTVTSNVQRMTGGESLGNLICVYHLRPTAVIEVSWILKWTAPDTHLWEVGLKWPVPKVCGAMHWRRHSYFTDYPAGHLGEPMGVAYANNPLFRASERDLHWMTLTDPSGAGVELLPNGAHPLVGRAWPDGLTNILFASAQVAGPQGLSESWVADHDIFATKNKPLTGSFILAATGATGK